MKQIPLTQGKYALVDNENFEWLSQWKWTYHYHGYAYRRDYKNGRNNGISIFMHRLIMNFPENMEIDHVNGDGLDNRKINLRLATHKQNIRNQKKQENRSSKYKGVSFYKNYNKWEAYICTSDRKYRLGYFKVEREAALAYDEVAKFWFGAYGRFNFE